MDHLGIEKANVVGWSDGGIIGLSLALNHRERVHKVVAFGANYNRTGLRADFMENPTFVGYLEKATTDYQEMSPAPERWDEFMANIGNTWASEPNFSAEQLGSITAPVLVVTGVNEEVIDEQHTREMAERIPSADLVLIPGTGHFAAWEKPEEFNQIVLKYLAGE